MRATMRSMEKKLDGRCFVRAHRRIIVAVKLISSIEGKAESRLAVKLTTGALLPAGRHYLPRLKEHVELT